MAEFNINTYSTTQMHFEQQLAYIPGGVEWIVKVLQEHMTGNVKACYVAVHNKDVAFDDDGNEKAVAPHVHIAIQFGSGVKVLSVLKWFGWEEMPQLFHKANEKARFGSLVSYLTHRTPNDRHKFQYSPDDVITIAGEKYPEALERVTGEVLRAERVQHGRTAEQNADKEEFISRILPGVDSGKITPYNISEHCTAEEYVKYRSAINTLFEYYEKRLSLQKERSMNVYFITGDAGSGKTTVAKEIACSLCNCELCDIYISSSGKNLLDDYGGQPVIIFDDLRASDLKFNDFLKLLDNNTASMAGCRYYNKSLIRCRCMIITTTVPLGNWYTGMQESNDEAGEQILRRITQIKNVKMNKEKWSYVFSVLTDRGWVTAPERYFNHITKRFNRPAEDALLSFGTPCDKVPEIEPSYNPYEGNKNIHWEEINDDEELPY